MNKRIEIKVKVNQTLINDVGSYIEKIYVPELKKNIYLIVENDTEKVDVQDNKLGALDE